MADKQLPHTTAPTAAQTAKAEAAARKQARLSQALKANMARRKGQARARRAEDGEEAKTGSTQDVQQKDT